MNLRHIKDLLVQHCPSQKTVAKGIFIVGSVGSILPAVYAVYKGTCDDPRYITVLGNPGKLDMLACLTSRKARNTYILSHSIESIQIAGELTFTFNMVCFTAPLMYESAIDCANRARNLAAEFKVEPTATALRAARSTGIALLNFVAPHAIENMQMHYNQIRINYNEIASLAKSARDAFTSFRASPVTATLYSIHYAQSEFNSRCEAVREFPAQLAGEVYVGFFNARNAILQTLRNAADRVINEFRR